MISRSTAFRWVHSRHLRLAGLFLAVGLILGAMPGAALAHALLLRADPPQDALLRSSPPTVHLWFSEDLNDSASRIVVWDRYRHDETAGPARGVPGHTRELEAQLRPLRPGSYLVLWTSVSAQDGHILHGSYLFSVKVRGPGPSLAGVSLGGTGQSFPNGAGLAALLAHWGELIAMLLWAGSAVFSLLIVVPVLGRSQDPRPLRREQGRLRNVVTATLALLIASSAVVFLMQLYGLAGNRWGSVLSGGVISEGLSAQYGKLWVAREIVAAAALIAGVATLGRPGRAGRNGLAGTALLAAFYLYLISASGHAAGSGIWTLLGSNLISGAVAVDWLHVAGAALWLGGQGYIVLVLIPSLGFFNWAAEPARAMFLDILNRFSPMAYVGIALASTSGVFNGAIHISSWYAFFNSIYGRALIVKLLLLGLMVLISTWTVFGLRPAIKLAITEASRERAAYLFRRLLGGLRINPVLGAGVLLATSVMFSYPVPAGFAPKGPSSYTLHLAGATATMSIKPDRSGPNTITVHLVDSAGRPITQAHVTILTTMLDMVMGTGIVSMQEGAPGTYSAVADLGMGGHWGLELLVYQPSGLTRAKIKVLVGT